MARRSGLGKGLGALIPPSSIEEVGSIFQDIPVASISPNARQPRSHFEEEPMAALTASVRELGVLQPVLVRPLGGGSYELIAGERRWRAAKRAGLQVVPAIVRTADDTSSLEQALVENLQREDLNPMDESAAYQQLIEDFRLTHEELAVRMGRSRAAISNALRLFQLPPSIQRMLADRKLGAGHARALLGSPDRAFQENLARRAVAEGMSVRAVEEAVRVHNEGATTASKARPPQPEALRPPGLLELEKLLSDHLDTRVKVEMSGNRGRVSVEFATLDDLERIYRAMTQRPARPA